MAVADRHIPRCATIKHRPKPPPTKDEVEKNKDIRRATHLRAKQASTGASQAHEQASPQDVQQSNEPE